MPIVSATSAKAYFETGDKPTQAEFTDLIDSAMRGSLIAIATAAEGGKTGIVNITGSAAVSLESFGAVGLQIMGAATTLAAENLLPRGGGFVLLASQAIDSSVAAVDFGSISSAYSTYMVTVSRVGMVDPNAALLLRFSFNSGSTFHAGANYSFHFSQMDENTSTYAARTGTAQTAIQICRTSGLAGKQSVNATIYLFRMGANDVKNAAWQYVATRASTGIYEGTGAGQLHTETSVVTGFRILSSNNQLINGRISLYGLNETNP